MENLYCKIYINAQLSETELLNYISSFVGIKSGIRTVSTTYFDLDVLKNDDFDLKQSKRKTDGFIYFPYYLEITSVSIPLRTEYINSIDRLLAHLCKNGISAVAACDFEDELITSSC